MRPPGGLALPMFSADDAERALDQYFAFPRHRAWAWNSAGPYFIAHSQTSRESAGAAAMGRCQRDQAANTRGTCSLFLLDDDLQWLFHPVTGRPIDRVVAEADETTRSRLAQNFSREYRQRRDDLAERLVGLAPDLDSHRTTLRSFAFAARTLIGKEPTQFPVAVWCWVEAPSDRACVILHDGVPAFVGIGDRILTYNPLDGPSLWHGDWEVRVEVTETQLHHGAELLSAGSAEAGVRLTLTSLVGGPGWRQSVRSLGGQRFLLSGAAAGGRQLEAVVDPAKPVAYSWLRVMDFDSQFAIEMTKITANQPPPRAAFRFPPLDEREVTLSPVTSLRSREEARAAMRHGPMTDFLVRAGMRDPAQRATVESRLGRPIDWPLAASRDETTGQSLKRAIEQHLQGLL